MEASCGGLEEEFSGLGTTEVPSCSASSGMGGYSFSAWESWKLGEKMVLWFL